jgi:hypothetical protein
LKSGKLTILPIDAVELDKTNPRIRRFLEYYAGEPSYDQIALALDIAGNGKEDAQGATTPEKLKRSILSNGGIMQPIIVNKEADGRHVCIEGNTRLYIYRSFVAEGAEGDWGHIPALVHEQLTLRDLGGRRLKGCGSQL